MKQGFQSQFFLLFLAGVGLITALIPQPRTVDDAFITFRYSRNLVAGNGFVYNIGEKVLGTTTPLYTLLMALMGGILGNGNHYPIYALIINALAVAISVILVFLITHLLTQKTSVATLAALLWAFAPFSITFAVGGMETPVHNLFMLATWYAYLDDSVPYRPYAIAAGCALGVLTRPDALLWALPLLAHQLWLSLRSLSPDERNWQGIIKALPWRTWLTGLLIMAPWLIFATFYFGSPLPHTISTKSTVYSLESTQALAKFLQHYSTPFFSQDTLKWIGFRILGIILYPALALIGLRAMVARNARALPLLSYPWLYALVFILINPLIFRWYLAPPVPAYIMAILCGIVALLDLLPNPDRARQITLVIGAMFLLFTLNAWTLRPDHAPFTPAPRMAFHDLELNYEKMVNRLRDDYGMTDRTVIAAGDIGAIGFYSQAYILDTVGLVTEDTVPYYQTPEIEALQKEHFYVIPPDLILDWQPEYVIMMELYIRYSLYTDPRFLEQYELIEEIPTEYYGDGMLLFRKRS